MHTSKVTFTILILSLILLIPAGLLPSADAKHGTPRHFNTDETIYSDVTIVGHDFLAIHDGATLTIDSSSTIVVDSGSLQIKSGGTLINYGTIIAIAPSGFYNDGTLINYGTITGKVHHNPIITKSNAPTGLTAIESGSNISLSWTAPANNGGAPITDYLVEYKLTSEPTVWSIFPHGNPSTTETVTGLTIRNPYDFRVSAINLAGAGTSTSVTFDGTNRAPVANDDDGILIAGTIPNIISVLDNDTDADGDTLFISDVKIQGLHGIAVILDPAFTAVSKSSISYNAEAGYNGPDSFTYTISDGITESAPATVTVTVDSIPPTITYDRVFNPTSGNSVITVKFSEELSSFDKSNVKLSRLTSDISNPEPTSTPNEYTFTFFPFLRENTTIEIIATDLAGNSLSGVTSFIIDDTPPSSHISIVGKLNYFNATGTLTARVVFSEPVVGFNATTVKSTPDNIEILEISNADPNGMFTVTMQMKDESIPVDADYSFRVPAGMVKDAAGNGNDASAPVTIRVDNIPPTVTSESKLANGKIVFTVTFEETPVEFDLISRNKPLVENGTIDTIILVNSKVYDVTVTPTDSTKPVKLTVIKNSSFDATKNGNVVTSFSTATDPNKIAPTLSKIELVNPDPKSGDYFGYSVSVSDDKILVGAAGDNGNTGAAHLFDMDGNKLKTINNPTPKVDDNFGESVAISGNKIVIGTPQDDTDATNTGSAYLYDINGNLLQTINNPVPVKNDRFGISVSMSNDKILVGAIGDNDGATNTGSAYLFDMDGKLLHTINNPVPVKNDRFGFSVSMSNDKILVGAYGVNGQTGVAYLYDATTGVLLKTIDNPDPNTYDNFGKSVSISGDKILVGAYYDNLGGSGRVGAAYLFDTTTGALLYSIPNPSPEKRDNFGDSVSISGDKIVIGASGDNEGAGAAYLYDATTGVLLHTINNPLHGQYPNFGSSVSMLDDKVVVGALGANNYAGAAYLYLMNTATTDPNHPVFSSFPADKSFEATHILTPLDSTDYGIPTATDNSGTPTVTSNSTGTFPLGDTIIQWTATDGSGNTVSQNQKITITDTTVPTITAPSTVTSDDPSISIGTATADDIFKPVTITNNKPATFPVGDTTVTWTATDTNGLSNTATQTVTITPSTTNFTPTLSKIELVSPDPKSGDYFGWSVSISDDKIIVGATGVNDSTGTAYLYNATTGERLQTINNPTSKKYDDFGSSVSISGEKIVIGATGVNGKAGAAYLYDGITGERLQTINNPTPTAWDNFGKSVSISGDKIVIGAYGDNDNVGIAYIFDMDGNKLKTINKPTPKSGDYFGYSVSVSDDKILVGAHGVNDGAGAAYLYDINGNLLHTINNPTPNNGDKFGSSVSISGDKIVIGAYGVNGNSGAAYLYDMDGNRLYTFQKTIPVANDYFGDSVSISGDKIVIGAYGVNGKAGAAYLYDGITGERLQTINSPETNGGDNFGSSVSISGEKIVIGAYGDNNYAGAAYLYLMNTATTDPNKIAPVFSSFPADKSFEATRILTPLNSTDYGIPTATDNSGTPTVTSNSTGTFPLGDTIVTWTATDTNANSVTKNQKITITDTTVPTITAPAGITSTDPSVSIGTATADDIFKPVTITNNKPATFPLGPTTVTWTATDTNGLFNTATQTVTITPSTTNFTPTLSKIELVSPDPKSGDYFGVSVAMSNDKILVGAYGDDTGAVNAGAVYLYDAITGERLQIINNPTPVKNDGFGESVAISGNKIVIGAQGDDTNANGAGSAYIYDGITGNLLHTINNPTPVKNDYFGESVAISGDKIVIGASGDDTGGVNAGAAYLYDMDGELLKTINNPSPVKYDYFGVSVAMSNDKIVLGAYGDDTGAVNAGAAYLYDMDGELLQTINNPAPVKNDYFGNAVSMSNDKIVLGAYGDDTGAVGAGTAYLYDMDGELLQTINNPAPVKNDYFGTDVSISGDKILVGTEGSNNFRGSAHLFDIDGTLLHTFNNPIADQYDYFGESVAISGDKIVIGAYGANGHAGAAYLYLMNTATTDPNKIAPTPTITTIPNPTTSNPIPVTVSFPVPVTDFDATDVTITGGTMNDDFVNPNDKKYTFSIVPTSTSVLVEIAANAAFDGDSNGNVAASLLISYPVVTYNPPIEITNPTLTTGDSFGWSVSISGEKILVGARYDDIGSGKAGAAYLFDMDGNRLQTIPNPTPEVDDYFGTSVSISGDKVLVGAQYDNTNATGTGSAYLYDANTGNLLQTINNPIPEKYDTFGWSVSMSDDKILVGTPNDDIGAAYDPGSAYLYDGITGDLLHTINNPTPEHGDYFGSSVSMSNDKIVIGATGDNTNATETGTVYLFDMDGDLLHTINNPTPEANDYFGSSVSISGDKVLIGAQYDNTNATNAGSAYLYDANTGNLLHTINNPTPNNGDKFGSSVAISGDKILVGAYYDDTGATNVGAAYLYDGITGDLLKTINNPTPEANDNFGHSVSIDGDNILIGAYGVDNADDSDGAVYLYLVDSGGVTIPGTITPDDTKKGGSDDNAHKTRPTFGLDHNTGRQLIEGGFSFNGVSHDITDNFWTPFAEQEVKIGQNNTFTIKTYADKQLHIQEFLFGIPEIGEAHNAELGVEVFFGYDGEIENINVVQKTDVIDVESVSVVTFDSKCTANDVTEKCNTTSLSMKFLEPLKDKVMALKAIDFKNRYLITYLNDGFDVTGESLNPMIVTTIPGTEKYEGLLKVTQNAKYSDTWTSEDGRTFEVNEYGTFKWTNETHERIKDTGAIKNRLHSEFAGYKDAVTEKAIIELLELCPTCLDSYTDFDDSWSYEFPKVYDLKTDDPVIRQKLIDENKRAQEIMNYLLEPSMYGQR